MPINYYDKPAEQKYIDTYVPVPFQEIMGSLQAHQNAYDEQQARTEDLQNNLLKVKNLPQDNALVKQRRDYYDTKINTAIQNAGGDYSKIGSEIRNISKEMKQDASYGPIAAAQENYNKNLEYQNELKILEQNGKISPEKRKFLIEYSSKRYQGIGQPTEQGFTQFSGIGPAHDMDLTGEILKKVQGWKEDGARTGKIKSLGNGQYFSVEEQKTIDEKDIYNQAANELKTNPEYRNYLNQEALMQTYGTDKATSQGMENVKEGLIKNAANFAAAKTGFTEYSYKDLRNEDHISPLEAAKLSAMLGGKAADYQTTTSQSEALTTKYKENSLLNSMEFDSKGTLVVPKKWGLALGNDPKQGKEGNLAFNGTEEGMNNLTSTRLQEQRALLNNFRNIDPKLSNKSEKEITSIYINSQKAIGTKSVPLENISNVAAANITDAIQRNKMGNNYYVMDGKGHTTTGTLQSVLEELNITEEDFNKHLDKQHIGGLIQSDITGDDSPAKPGVFIEIPNKKGVSRRVTITVPNQLNQILSGSANISRSLRTLSPASIEAVPGIKYSTTPKYNERTNEVEMEITEDLYNPNTKQWTGPMKTSLSEIRKQELAALKNSNYLGTDLTVLKKNTTE